VATEADDDRGRMLEGSLQLLRPLRAPPLVHRCTSGRERAVQPVGNVADPAD